MSFFRLYAALLAVWFLAPALWAQTAVQETRSTLEKWVETRQLISKATSDWQAEKETFEQTARVYERELKALDEQLSKVSTNSAQAERERTEAASQKAASDEALTKARKFAEEFEGQATKLVPQLPLPLQEILKPLLRRVPTDPSTRMGAAERIQVLVGILNEIDKFNNSISVFSEKRKNGKGEEVAVDTFYVGLGAAYFVNEAGDFAGAGVPANAGWEWSIQPELASAVREAVRIYRNDRPARFISLPAAIR